MPSGRESWYLARDLLGLNGEFPVENAVLVPFDLEACDHGDWAGEISEAGVSTLHIDDIKKIGAGWDSLDCAKEMTKHIKSHHVVVDEYKTHKNNQGSARNKPRANFKFGKSIIIKKAEFRQHVISLIFPPEAKHLKCYLVTHDATMESRWLFREGSVVNPSHFEAMIDTQQIDRAHRLNKQFGKIEDVADRLGVSSLGSHNGGNDSHIELEILLRQSVLSGLSQYFYEQAYVKGSAENVFEQVETALASANLCRDDLVKCVPRPKTPYRAPLLDVGSLPPVVEKWPVVPTPALKEKDFWGPHPTTPTLPDLHTPNPRKRALSPGPIDTSSLLLRPAPALRHPSPSALLPLSAPRTSTLGAESSLGLAPAISSLEETPRLRKRDEQGFSFNKPVTEVLPDLNAHESAALTYAKIQQYWATTKGQKLWKKSNEDPIDPLTCTHACYKHNLPGKVPCCRCLKEE